MQLIHNYSFKGRKVVGRSDEPFSLMTGISGDIVFMLDVMKGSGYFPGYDL